MRPIDAVAARRDASSRRAGPRAARPRRRRGPDAVAASLVARHAVEATSARRRGGGVSQHGRAIAERGLREHRTHRLISTQVDIRGKKIPTKVAKMPFVEPNYWRVPE